MRYFLDTEFNGFGGELISLALVCEDGRELYLAKHWFDGTHPWVKENVEQVILAPGASPIMADREEFGPAIRAFIGLDRDPVIYTDWPDDIRYFCECLITGPGMMVNIPQVKFIMLRVDAYPTTLEGAVQHNALWDARALKYLLMREGE